MLILFSFYYIKFPFLFSCLVSVLYVVMKIKEKLKNMKKRKNKDDPSGWRSSWSGFFGGVSSVSHFPSFCFHCGYVLLEPRVAQGSFLTNYWPMLLWASFWCLPYHLSGSSEPWITVGDRVRSPCLPHFVHIYLVYDYMDYCSSPSPSTPGIMNIANALFLISRCSHVGTGHTSQRFSLACPRGGR